MIIFIANLFQQLALLYIKDSGHDIRPIYNVAVTVYMIYDFWSFQINGKSNKKWYRTVYAA
jgi:hypothetical protein